MARPFALPQCTQWVCQYHQKGLPMSLHLGARHIRRCALIVAACLALLTLSMLPSQSASANSATPRASQPKPSIVLVHGAWADGSSWSKVIQDLQGKGYTVYAPPNPLR